MRALAAFLCGVAIAGGGAYWYFHYPKSAEEHGGQAKSPSEFEIAGVKQESLPVVPTNSLAAPPKGSGYREAASTEGRLSSPAPAPARTRPGEPQEKSAAVHSAQSPSQTAEPPQAQESTLEPLNQRRAAVDEPTTAKPPEAKPEPRQPRKVTIAGGTLIAVRLAERVSSETHKAGDSFLATLDQPLIIDGLVIAERGSRAEGRIKTSEDAGRVKGTASISLELVRLNTSDGQRVEIQTDAFTKEGPTSYGADAAKVGAAAGIGAALGAIFGGGRGAGIGAAAGGAAGAGTVMATRGKPAELPAETKISFRVSAPAEVVEKLR
jgi:hypothetical protein